MATRNIPLDADREEAGMCCAEKDPGPLQSSETPQPWDFEGHLYFPEPGILSPRLVAQEMPWPIQGNGFRVITVPPHLNTLIHFLLF